MNASLVPKHERSFFDTGLDSEGKKHLLRPFSANVPGTGERVAMVECSRENEDTSFFFEAIFPKNRIVLHFTAGYLKGDVARLTTPDDHVSVPFVIARDGRIYNLWTSKFWSFHLGKGAKGGNEVMSRSSVGIELSNIGPLRRLGDDLHTIYSTAERPDVYCTVAENTLYTQVPAYRGEEFFATFPDAQYTSLIQLLRFLTARFGIERTFLPVEKRFEALDDITSFRGITSHVNYRPSGKWDLGPAFDWARVIAGVQAATPRSADPMRAARPEVEEAPVTTAPEPADPSGPKTTRPDAEERRLPERRRSAADRLKKTFDAAPDRVDVRDWFYPPSLGSIPDRVINIDQVPEILDQGQEGACTGFALAGAINFLLARRGVKRSVSPRMLYEMARLYDEWPGQQYEGSSARGAMKGWMRHGVCTRTEWKDKQRGLGGFYRPLDAEGTRTVADSARSTPGGAFYRVAHRDVRDMHSALAETGILYCTLMVHEGWGTPGPSTETYELSGERVISLPVIERRGRADGGHAVALVGYTEHGFVVQNSWGTDWGFGGFALLPYEDYLLHATDVWVMQLGVPLRADLWAQGNTETTAGLQRAQAVISLEKIRPFMVDIGNNGELSTSGDYWNTEPDVERLFTNVVLEQTKNWKKRRILLYLHGGLNSERSVAQRILAFRDVLLENEIYPIHLMWETGVVETLNGLLHDYLSTEDSRAAGVSDWLRKLRAGLYEAKDRTLELTLARPGTALWGEMKQNARFASDHPNPKKQGAMELIAHYAGQALATLDTAALEALEVHVVAHSAGSIFTAHAIKHLADLGPAFKSLQFLAPALRVDEFRDLLLPYIKKGTCPRPRLYVLSDAGERDDNVGPYGRSLLYLVSNAFEGKTRNATVGNAAFPAKPARWLAGRGRYRGNGPLQRQRGGRAPVGHCREKLRARRQRPPIFQPKQFARRFRQ